MRLFSLALIAACGGNGTDVPRTQAVPTGTSTVWTGTATSPSTETGTVTDAWTLNDVPDCAGPDAAPVDLAIVNDHAWVLLADDSEGVTSACLLEVRPDGTVLEATHWNLGADTTPGALAIHDDGTPWVLVHHDGDFHVQSWNPEVPEDEVVRPGLHDADDMQSLDFTRNGFLMLGYLAFDEVDTASGQDCMLRTYKPDPATGDYSILDIQTVSRLAHTAGDDTCGEFVTRDDGLVQHAMAPRPVAGGSADLALFLQDQTVPSFWMTGLVNEGAVQEVARGQMVALDGDGVLLSSQSSDSTDSDAATLAHLSYVDGYGQQTTIGTDDRFRVWSRAPDHLVSANVPLTGGTLTLEILDLAEPFSGPIDGMTIGSADAVVGVASSAKTLYVLSVPDSTGGWELWSGERP